jgi:hypothetical protein
VIEFVGPIENHVELARHRTRVALNHQEPFAVWRDIVTLVPVVNEKVRPVKKLVWGAERPIRPESHGDNSIPGYVE